LTATKPTIGDLLRGHLDKNGQQKQVAIAWWEQWRARAQDDISRETVISRLSGVLNDKSEGIRFFFNDPGRANLLLEILEVPPAERNALIDIGRAATEDNGVRPARLVVDISTVGSDLDAIARAFLFVERDVMAPALARQLRPVALVLTPDQYRHLPRLFDDFGSDLQIERAADPAAAWDTVMDRAGDQAVVLSARRFPVFHRWIAAQFGTRHHPEVVQDPPDALQRLCAEGALPLLAQVVHPVEELGVTPWRLDHLPDDPVEFRRLMAALGDETPVPSLRYPPEQRLWLSQQLGVPATSTAAERGERDIQAAALEQGLKIRDVSKPELAQILARAQRRLLEPTALRAGGVLHLINPSKPVSERAHTKIEVHHIESKPAPLARLRELVETRTEADWLDDPFMELAIARLDPEGTARPLFAHARATLMLSGVLAPRPTAPLLRDWRQALATLLREPPPAARLRLPFQPNSRYYPHPGHGDQARDSRPLVEQLLETPPLGDVIVSRTDAWKLVTRIQSIPTTNRRYGRSAVLLCIDPAHVSNVDLWLDLVDHSPALGAPEPDDDDDVSPLYALLHRHGIEAVAVLQDRKSAGSGLGLPESLWRAADRELALAWWAMRQALQTAPDCTMHDGTGMLALGNAGVFAEVRITDCQPREDDHVRASLTLPIEENYNWKLGSLVELVPSLILGNKGATSAGYLLPQAIQLRGPSTLATIRFGSSPLLTRAAGQPGQTADHDTAAAALAEHQRQEQEYDDDDD
jgi:hypothetical protein